jgi:hypothetical protein
LDEWLKKKAEWRKNSGREGWFWKRWAERKDWFADLGAQLEMPRG